MTIGVDIGTGGVKAVRLHLAHTGWQIEGALAEEGCIAYSWTEDHLTPGRVWVYEEWTTSEALSAHLASHWYRDMGAHLASYDRKPMTNIIKKYRVDHEEPVYDDTGTARGDFFTA